MNRLHPDSPRSGPGSYRKRWYAHVFNLVAIALLMAACYIIGWGLMALIGAGVEAR